MNELTAWFSSVDPTPASRWLALALTAAVLVVGTWLHWPAVFPGPVSAAERSAARGSRRRRRAARVGYWTASATLVGALVMLGLSPRRPVTLLLESRAQVLPFGEGEESCETEGAETVAFRQVRSSTPVKDLGVLVDEVLRRCGAECRPLLDGSADQVQHLSRLIREVVLDEEPRTLNGAAEVSSGLTATGEGRFPTISRAVIESVEISVIQLAQARFNAREVRVLAGTSFESRASWEVARALLGANGKRFRLCGAGASPLPGGPVITRLAQASWTPRQTLVGWALVQGRFAPGATAAEFELTLEAWGATQQGPAPAPLSFRVQVPPDDLSGRIIELCFGTGCPRDSGLSPTLGQLVASARAVGAAIRLRADRASSGMDVWSAVHDDSGASALELVVDRPLLKKWAPLFEQLRSGGEQQAFRAELESMGLQVPQLVLSGSSVRTANASAGPDWIAIAVDEAATQRAAFSAGAGPPPSSAEQGRVRPGALTGPSTVFSLASLSVRPALDPRPRPLGVLVTADFPAGSDPQAQGRTGRAPIVREGQEGPGRPFVVLGLEGAEQRLVLGSAEFEPVAAMAMVRVLAWAAQRVRDGAVGVPPRLSSQRESGSALARPLIAASEAQEATRVGLRPFDGVLLLAIGLCLSFSVVVLVRRTPVEGQPPRSR